MGAFSMLPIGRIGSFFHALAHGKRGMKEDKETKEECKQKRVNMETSKVRLWHMPHGITLHLAPKNSNSYYLL